MSEFAQQLSRAEHVIEFFLFLLSCPPFPYFLLLHRYCHRHFCSDMIEIIYRHFQHRHRNRHRLVVQSRIKLPMLSLCSFFFPRSFSVVESSQGMLDAKMNAINQRMNRVAEKYEKIKQLEDQMRESNQILDLLLERR